jgi:hypothetical protein
MEYIVIKRTKLHGDSDDLLSIEKDSKNFR